MSMILKSPIEMIISSCESMIDKVNSIWQLKNNLLTDEDI
jgi:hypothetical protein